MRYLQVCYTNALVIFFSISDSFSDLVSLLCVCITEKPGVCPRGFDGVRLCKELCVNDIDCPTMRNAAALNVDIRVHLHFKGIFILMLGSPTIFFIYSF